MEKNLKEKILDHVIIQGEQNSKEYSEKFKTNTFARDMYLLVSVISDDEIWEAVSAARTQLKLKQMADKF